MTQRKIKICAYIKGSSPKAHEKHQHDWRPKICRDRGCIGALLDCENKLMYTIKERAKIKEMLAYLKKIREKKD